jgi:hypothetical protein
MPSLSDFLKNSILNKADVITAKVSGALSSTINGGIAIVDNFLSKLLGGIATLANIGTLILTFAEENVVRIDQKITSTIIDPIKVPITANSTSLSFAEAAATSTVTAIAPTQLNDLVTEPVGIEPPMAFRGQYPYVHTFKSESGHIKEIDDTPGYERLLDYHKAGTYQEIDADGRRVLKVVGDNFVVIVGSDTIYVEGNRSLQVRGNMNITCLNDVSINVGGRVEVNATEDLKLKARSISLETTSGDVNIYSAGGLNTQSQGDLNVYSRSKLNLLSASAMSIAALKTLALGAVEKASIEALGAVAIDAPTVFTNKGQSVPVAAANTITSATKKTGLGTGPTRENTSAPSITESVIQGLDDDETAHANAIKDAIASGRLTQGQVDALKNKTYAVDETDNTDASRINPLATTANTIKILPETGISGQLKLSSNYHLCHLTDGGPLYPQKLIAQNGKTKAQIAGNLSLLAQNVLEPIASKFGPITINSAFRQGTGKSQHTIGMAVDITYGTRSTDPATMYAIAQWIKTHVAFDQLILEYGDNQIWTHISFNGEGSQRYQILTCPNPANPKYVSGLQKLAWSKN